ncbi:hypothetical protein [Micromonospora sp. RP3T]|uniref:hypothetical protein n=1 Tax=Micromonospora sp. RP3T TaxID=2135446 RepID=UPI003D70EA42
MSDSGATERAREPTASRAAAEPEPDVLLDVPELSVDEIRLTVDGLDADLSLRARLANLLQLDAGVRVHLEGVELDITGVRAEALLKVRLEKLVQILDRALTTIDRNPQLIDALARSVGVTVDDVHRAAGRVAGPVVEEVAETGEVLDRAGRQVPETGEVVDRAGQIERRTPSGPGARVPVRRRDPQPRQRNGRPAMLGRPRPDRCASPRRRRKVRPPSRGPKPASPPPMTAGPEVTPGRGPDRHPPPVPRRPTARPDRAGRPVRAGRAGRAVRVVRAVRAGPVRAGRAARPGPAGRAGRARRANGPVPGSPVGRAGRADVAAGRPECLGGDPGGMGQHRPRR